MPRNMSFMITTEQIKNRTKTVTRRLGWNFLKPGEVVNACEKCRGLKAGQKVQHPKWHNWLMGRPQPQSVPRKARSIVTGAMINLEHIDEYNELFRNLILERRGTG